MYRLPTAGTIYGPSVSVRVIGVGLGFLVSVLNELRISGVGVEVYCSVLEFYGIAVVV